MQANGHTNRFAELMGYVPSESDQDEPERVVLGSMLRDVEVIGDILQILRPEEFRTDANQKIFRTIVALYEAGKPADAASVAEELKAAKQLENCGGYAYFGDLLYRAPTAIHAEHYARIVREKYIHRELVFAGHHIQQLGEKPTGAADQLLEDAERRIFAIAQVGLSGSTVTLEEAISKAYDRMDARAGSPEKFTGIQSGFIDLDRIIVGFQDGELALVGARPGVGKSAFALAILRHAVVNLKVPAFVSSLEMSQIELSERLLCAQGRVDSYRVRAGKMSGDDIQRYISAGDPLRSGGKLFIDDTPGQTVLRIAANARRLRMRYGIRLVVVDYLQLIEPDDRRVSRHEQVAVITRKLKLLARDLNIPVIALAQVNRGSEDRAGHKPRLADFRESGSCEQDCDTALLLHVDKDQPYVMEIEVAKQRNGPTGDVKLTFQREFIRFENYAEPFGGHAER